MIQDDLSKNLPLALLGLPLSNLNLVETVRECMERIQDNKQTGKVSYLSMIDSTLITKCYGWLPTTIDNPELLTILRHTTISSISGTFLERIGKLLGSSITPSYTPKELLFTLCQALSEKEKGVFLLGELEKETKNAAIDLHDKFTKLRIVGIATPPVFIEGEDLVNAKERDALLIEQINSSNADALIVNLGSAKQEVWLERVRQYLFVPLIVCVNHALSDISLFPVQKASWTNKINFNSVWHSLKLMGMSLPLLFYHSLSRFLYHIFYAKSESSNKLQNSQLFLSTHRSIAVIVLPGIIDSTNAKNLMQRFEEAASHDALVFDFRNVFHIQPEGFYILLKVWLQRYKQNKEIYGIGTSADIECLMKLHHTWDIFHHTLCDSAEMLMSRLKAQEHTTFYDTFTQTENLVTIRILGALDNRIDYDLYMKKIIPIIGQKNCSIDFTYCTFIDNTGFAFLLNLRKHLHMQHHKLSLHSVTHPLSKQFKNAKLDTLFVFQ